MTLELIKGATLLFALSLLQSFNVRFWGIRKTPEKIVSGGLFGGICVIGMMMPLEVASGVLFDARSVILSMSGLFGGPIVGGVAAVIAGGYHAWIGGGGANVGVAIVFSSMVLGLLYRYCWGRGWVKIGFFQLLVFGLVVHVAEFALFTQLPDDVVQKVMDNVALPLLLIFTLATAVLGMLLQDIENRTATEAALRLSEKSLRMARDQLESVLSNLPGGIYRRVLRPDGADYTEFYMGQLPRTLGVETQFGVNSLKVVSDFTFPEYVKIRGDAIRQSADQMTPCIFEYPVRMPDGSNLWVQSVSIPHYRDNGDIVWDGINLDITQRKQAEEKLYESEKRLREAVESLQEGFVLFDAEDRLVMVNDVYRRSNPMIQGILEKGLRFEDLIRGIAESGYLVEAVGREEEFIRERVKQHRNPKGRIIRQTRDGKWRMIHDVRTLEGGTVLTVTDITGLKVTEKALLASEQRLKDIAEAVSDWFWEMDENLRFSFFSERRKSQTGLPTTENIGMTRWEVADADLEKDEIWRAHRAMLENHEPFRDFQYEYTSSLGRSHVSNVSGKPIFDDQGTFKGYRGTAIDITDRKRTEDTLRQLQKVKAIGQLTGGIAHDFNNLLHVISGNLDMLDEDLLHDPTAQKMIQGAKKAAFRGGELTQKLLSFSREQSLNAKIVDANDRIAEMIEILGRTLGEDIIISTAYGDGLRMINIDHGILGNAILNLAINARDAMPNGGEIKFRTDNVNLDKEAFGEDGTIVSGDYVMITVSDTGTGMDAETLNRVFEPFFTTKEVGKGCGMGLSMVYGFVTQSGGYLSIDSEKGKGTTVRLYFTAADADTADARETVEKTKFVAKGDETILVVEDNSEVRKVMAVMLGRLGYEVLEAEDGPSALALLGGGENSIDLVLSDVVMPAGMSGLDLARELKRHYQGIKMLMTSGYPEGKIRARDLDEFGTTLLRKPCKLDELAQAVRSSLDQ